jgi:hypothetical protein
MSEQKQYTYGKTIPTPPPPLPPEAYCAPDCVKKMGDTYPVNEEALLKRIAFLEDQILGMPQVPGAPSKTLAFAKKLTVGVSKEAWSSVKDSGKLVAFSGHEACQKLLTISFVIGGGAMLLKELWGWAEGVAYLTEAYGPLVAFLHK